LTNIQSLSYNDIQFFRSQIAMKKRQITMKEKQITQNNDIETFEDAVFCPTLQ
jgi:5-bromo-4-chloroindolyl phosphate hydrolysis protein